MRGKRLAALVGCCVVGLAALFLLSAAVAQGAEEPKAATPAAPKAVDLPPAPPKAMEQPPLPPKGIRRPGGRPIVVGQPATPRDPDALQGELPSMPERPAEALPGDYFASLGQVYMQYGQWTKAEECYQEAYKKEQDPARRAPYAHRLAQLHMRKKEYDKAQPLLDEALKQPATGPNAYEFRRYRMTLAALCERTNQLPKAEEIYQEWLKVATTSYERDSARRELLRLWERSGKLANAIEVYEAALKQNPKDSEALETLRIIYTALKPNAEKAVAIAEQLAAVKPDDREAVLSLFTAYERANQPEKAIALATKLLQDKKTGDHPYLVNRLISLYVQTGQKDKAAEYATRLLAQEPKTAELHAQVAGLYQMLGKAEEAVAQYESAARLSDRPDVQERYLLSAAQAARRIKQYEKAEGWVRQLLKSQNPTVAAQAKRLLFELYEEQNKLDQLQVGPEKK